MAVAAAAATTYYSVALAAQGPGKAPLVAALPVVTFIAGGAAADVYSTLHHSPDLAREANPYVRGLLDAGVPLEAVLAGGLVFQVLTTLGCCALWILFLKHKEVYLRWAGHGMATKAEFVKAGYGGRDLNWLQFCIPLSLRDAPHPYGMVLLLSLVIPWMSWYRWWLGFEWFGLVPTLSMWWIVASILGLLAVHAAWMIASADSYLTLQDS